MELNGNTARGRFYFLKIKLKHLAEEARIIRYEEIKTARRIKQLKALGKDTTRLEWRANSLYLHRIGIVRWEARATQLAYCLLRGKAKAVVENGTTIPKHILDKVARMVADYGELEEDGRSINLHHLRLKRAEAITRDWVRGDEVLLRT